MYGAIAVYGSTTVREVMSMVSSSNANTMLETYTKMHMNRHTECVKYLFFNDVMEDEIELNCEYSGLPSVKFYDADDYNSIY
jgi:hypothetical protein